MNGRSSISQVTTPAPYAPSNGVGPLTTAWQPQPPRAPLAEEGGGIPWGRYLAAVKRYKWLILVMIVAGSALGVAATRLMAPEYEAQATIWINSTTQNDRQRGPIRAGELLQSIAWIELLRSFAITDAVVEQLGLYVTPQVPADSAIFRAFRHGRNTRPGRYVLNVGADGVTYTLSNPDNRVLERGTLGDSVGRSLGFLWVPPARLQPDQEVAFRVTTPRDASVELTRNLQAALPEESNFLRLRLAGSDPQRVARTLNAWANQFVTSAAQLKKRNLVDFESTLASQLLVAERELRSAEIALENFRASTITLETDAPVAGGVEATRAPVLNSYFERKQEYDNLRHDREAFAAAIANVERGTLAPDALLGQPGMDRAPSLQAAVTELNAKQGQLRTARQTYTEAHPTVRTLASSVQQLEQVTIPGLARSHLAQLQRREQELERRIQSASRELRGIPPRTIEEMRLRRQVAVTETLYNTLKSRYEEAKLAEASATPDVTVLDSAVTPSRPNSNTAPRIVMLAVIASVGAAIGLALLLDRLDKRFRYADQASKDLRLQILGAVPTLKMKGRRSGRRAELAAQVLESFRSLRLSLHFAFPTGERVALAVSSPGVGEGKSLISANLALSFAEAGFRTVLVDGDIRRGELHRTFDIERVPGLIDFLHGDASEREISHATAYQHLTVVPCGTRRHSGPELLTTDRLAQFVHGLRAHYEVVIIDTPPLSAGIDAYALSTVVGSMMLVLRTGTTDRHLAEMKLKTADRLPVRVLGAVLNDFDADPTYEYYAYSYSTTADADEAMPRGGTLGALGALGPSGR